MNEYVTTKALYALQGDGMTPRLRRTTRVRTAADEHEDALTAHIEQQQRLLARIDTLEATIARTIRKVKRRSFWLGFVSALVGSELVRWLA